MDLMRYLMRPFTQEEIDWYALRAIIRTDPDDFMWRPLNPPPAVYYEIIGRVADEIWRRQS